MVEWNHWRSWKCVDKYPSINLLHPIISWLRASAAIDGDISPFLKRVCLLSWLYISVSSRLALGQWFHPSLARLGALLLALLVDVSYHCLGTTGDGLLFLSSCSLGTSYPGFLPLNTCPPGLWCRSSLMSAWNTILFTCLLSPSLRAPDAPS